MSKYFTWPVPGFYRVSSGFMTAERPNHMGIDIGRNINPPQSIDGAVIVAAADGRVADLGINHASKGNWVLIDHGDGWASRYMHNQINMVGMGQYVRQGEPVGLVGSTGRSSGPHLHFELIRDGRHLDPVDYLVKAGQRPACAGMVIEMPAAVDFGPVGLPVWARFLAWLRKLIR